MALFAYDESSYLTELLQFWTLRSIKYYRKNPPTTENLFNIPKSLNPQWEIEMLENFWNEEKQKQQPNFFKAFFRVIRLEFYVCVIVLAIAYMLYLSQVIGIYYFVEYLSDNTLSTSYGILLGLSFILIFVFTALFKVNSVFKCTLLLGKVKSIIAITICKKLLKLSNLSLLDSNSKGKIVNIVIADMEMLEQTSNAISCLCIPLILILTIVIIVIFFGPIGLIGTGASVMHLPFIICLSQQSSKHHLVASKIGDERIKLIQNLIYGIKVLKLYAWEQPILKSIKVLRSNEISSLKKSGRLFAGLTTFGLSGSLFSLFITVIVQVICGYNIEVKQIFMLGFLYIVTHGLIAYVSIQGLMLIFTFLGHMERIKEILILPEFISFQDTTETDLAVDLENASFAWKKEKDIEICNENEEKDRLIQNESVKNEAVLKGITLKIHKNELVIVIGQVGSGKSSLFLGLLGELVQFSGYCKTSNSMSFLSEDPWILSKTIKENIILNKPFEADLYNQTLSSCALNEDLLFLKDGDNTLLGERGITLSGGQRVRLCLARCVYANTDVVLLDDPLSAVDTEVANHLFFNCIQKELKGKTVILSTNQTQFLQYADKILVLDEGRAVFYGTFEELQENQGKYLIDILPKHKGKLPREPEFLKEVYIEKPQENDEIVNSDMQWLKSLWDYTYTGFKSVWVFILILAFSLIFDIVSIVFYYYTSFWSEKSDQSQKQYYLTYSGIILACYIFCALRLFPIIELYLNCNRITHDKAIKGLALTHSGYFDVHNSGEVITRFSKDVGIMDGPLQISCMQSIIYASAVLCFISVLIIIMPINAGAFLFSIIIWWILLKYLLPIIHKLRNIELISRDPIISLISQSVNNLPSLRCFNYQCTFETEFIENINIFYRAHLTFNVYLRFIQLYFEVITISIVALNIIIIVIFKDTISAEIGAFSIISTVIILVYAHICPRSLADLNCNLASVDRLKDFAKLPSEETLKDPENFQISQGSIVFDSVSMRYQAYLNLALNNLSFTIKAQEKVAIVGRTGSGKSSILQVLFRLVNPVSGKVYIDGQDFMKAGLHQLRSQMSVIPQSLFIFIGSVKYNLDPFSQHTNEEITEVLKEVQLLDYVLSFEKGLDSIVVDEINFSFGQKQLLCLARAILRKNNIVMMDEATANVDNDTDRVIQEIIKKKFRFCTMIIIAHRLRTVIRSEKIIVMDKGQCVEVGRPEELVKNENSLFKILVESTGKEECAFLMGEIMRKD